MATVQHPMFEHTKRVVDDPEPWIEQGWLEVPDEDPRAAVYTDAPEDAVPAEAKPEPVKADPDPEMKAARPKPAAPDKK